LKKKVGPTMKTLLAVLILSAAMSFGQTDCNSTADHTKCTNQETGHSIETTCSGDSCHTRDYYGEGYSGHDYRACWKAIHVLKKEHTPTAQANVNEVCAGMHKAEKWITADVAPTAPAAPAFEEPNATPNPQLEAEAKKQEEAIRVLPCRIWADYADAYGRCVASLPKTVVTK
jgi:hypothetical protein